MADVPADMSEEEWERRWAEHIKDKCSLAVNCKKCKKAVAFCDCAKKIWIDTEKDKLGIPVDKPYTCYKCKLNFINIWIYYENNQPHNICDTCLEDERKRILGHF